MSGTLLTATSNSEQSLTELLADGLFIDGDWVESKDQNPNGEVRLIQLADVGDGVFRDRSSRFLTMAKAKELRCTFLEPGDVLVARMPEPLGRACVFPGVGQPAVTVVDVCILRPQLRRVRPEWLVKSINSPQFRSSMQEFVRGTTRQRISRKNLGTLRLCVPPVSEQMQVAGVLDRFECRRSSADLHIRCARRAIDRFRQAVLVAACSGLLTADWRERRASLHESARRLSKIVEPLVEIPDEWSWAQLQDIADVRGGIQKGAKLRPGEATREVPYLRVANVQRGWLDLGEIKTIHVPESKVEDLRLKPGDILFNEGGDRDKLGRGWVWEGQIEECIHQNHVFRARLQQRDMQPRFYSWYGNTIGAGYFVDQGKQTVNLASLSMTKLKELPVPIPSVEEQAEIVRRVDEYLAVAERLLARVETAARRVDHSTQAVLAKAFRGQLVGDLT
ncbi:MAG: restriction endonuclease subunit S [Chloroflexota bacterium]|nr:restriction endonuclease subunit S [Chloroflexota bacterium]